MQWLVLCGIPYRGLGGSCLTRPNEPAPQLLPPAATWQPRGNSTASVQLLKSSTRYPGVQAAPELNLNALKQLTENSNWGAEAQAGRLWKAPAFCGKRAVNCG